MTLLLLDGRGGRKKCWDPRCTRRVVRLTTVILKTRVHFAVKTVKPGAANPGNSLFLHHHCNPFSKSSSPLRRLKTYPPGWVGLGRRDWTQSALFPVHSPSLTFQFSPQILGTAQHPINFISTQATRHQFLLFCNQKLDTEWKQLKVKEMKGFLSLILTHCCSKNYNWVMCF